MQLKNYDSRTLEKNPKESGGKFAGVFPWIRHFDDVVTGSDSVAFNRNFLSRIYFKQGYRQIDFLIVHLIAREL